MKRALLIAGFVAYSASLYAQAPAAVASRTKTHVTTLASDQLEGRLSGSAGEQRASAYIVSELQRIGAKPLPGQTGYTVPFEFTAGVGLGDGNVLTETGATPRMIVPVTMISLSASAAPSSAAWAAS